MSFSSQVSKGIQELQDELEAETKALLIETFSRTIVKTPVKTGRLRNNWHTNIGSVDTGEREAKKSGSDSSSDAVSSLRNFELGKTVFFSNNLPYAKRVEDGNFSTQAPNGMLKVSVFEVFGVLI